MALAVNSDLGFELNDLKKACFTCMIYVKCVSKVLGHLSKPAAPTSVPGLLRQTLSTVQTQR